MEITIDQRSEVVASLWLAGRLEMGDAMTLRERLLQLVASGRSRLVVNLAGVTFVDSMGVGALLAGLKAARRAGGDLRLASPPEQARMILRLTVLDSTFRLYVTEAEALEGL
jgi:anti-anti-sigma factor